jgi:hypothetical protein
LHLGGEAGLEFAAEDFAGVIVGEVGGVENLDAARGPPLLQPQKRGILLSSPQNH